ncbi:uncharacterized protein EI90DRAFT_3018625 [Cantharellus anzutake]|uniref:uncharacterized protein n=1 Tax=Cantharellus anzutake TaxID=1750568 RepID=UPI001905B076|nr:uncharacterized protein EI90DRAFT_3018625 [Cantharellus anzutake]KAF8326297.1 hypothetical protein EI90DRAFT_3018625 [Cantharellus anzutake]
MLRRERRPTEKALAQAETKRASRRGTLKKKDSRQSDGTGNLRNIASQLELGDSGDDWEEYRRRNIEENQELLRKIGLGDPLVTPGKRKNPNRKRKHPYDGDKDSSNEGLKAMPRTSKASVWSNDRFAISMSDSDVAIDSLDTEEQEIAGWRRQEDEEHHQRRKQRISQKNSTRVTTSTVPNAWLRGGENQLVNPSSTGLAHDTATNTCDSMPSASQFFPDSEDCLSHSLPDDDEHVAPPALTKNFRRGVKVNSLAMGQPMDHIWNQIKPQTPNSGRSLKHSRSPSFEPTALKHSQSPPFEASTEDFSGCPDSGTNITWHRTCTTLREWKSRTNETADSLMVPVLKTAFELYHISLLLNQPFPVHDENESFATHALSEAFQEHHLANVNLTGDMILTVTKTASRFRGIFKTAASASVRQHMHLAETNDENVNRKIVSAALQHENFCFAEYDTETNKCRGALQHPCIQETILAFFTPTMRRREASLHRNIKAFEKMPRATVAFSLTAIQCALKEWETGRHLTTEFSGSSFFNIYQSHLDWIIQWSERRPKEWLNISSSLGNAAFKYIVDTKAELPEACMGEGRTLQSLFLQRNNTTI